MTTSSEQSREKQCKGMNLRGNKVRKLVACFVTAMVCVRSNGFCRGQPTREINPVDQSAFNEGQGIPAVAYACDGRECFAGVEMERGAEGNAEFRADCEDPDAPGGTWVHWVALRAARECRRTSRKRSAGGKPAWRRHARNSTGSGRLGLWRPVSSAGQSRTIIISGFTHWTRMFH